MIVTRGMGRNESTQALLATAGLGIARMAEPTPQPVPGGARAVFMPILPRRKRVETDEELVMLWWVSRFGGSKQ